MTVIKNYLYVKISFEPKKKKLWNTTMISTELKKKSVFLHHFKSKRLMSQTNFVKVLYTRFSSITACEQDEIKDAFVWAAGIFIT